jgi:hypothetical protein
MLRNDLSNEITNKKHKNVKTGHLMDHEKDTSLQYEDWNKKTECHFAQPWLRMHGGKSKFFTVLNICISINDCESALSIDLG